MNCVAKSVDVGPFNVIEEITMKGWINAKCPNSRSYNNLVGIENWRR